MKDSTICPHHHVRTVLLVCVVLLGNSLHAQIKEKLLNLSIHNATLNSFVKQTESATDFTFIYGEDVRMLRLITLEIKRQATSGILQRVLRDEPMKFEISGKHIVLYKRPVPQKTVSRKLTVNGYVTGGVSFETLIGTNILESRRSIGTAASPYGSYTLILPEGNLKLIFSYLDYEILCKRFILTKDTLLNA